MTDRIEREIAMPHERFAPARVTADQRAHAGAEFVEIERLDEIIVRAGVETFHAIRDGIACRDDQHRQRVRAGAQRLQHVEAVALGQAEVEQHQVVGLAADGRERGLAVLHPIDRKAVRAQRLAHALGDHPVIFD